MKIVDDMFWDLIQTHVDGIPVKDRIFLDHFGSEHVIEDKMDLGLCEFINWDPIRRMCDDIRVSFNRALVHMQDDVIRDITCHEVAHAIVGVSEEEHGSEWEEIVYALGGTPRFV
jgi:hypothetical protein